MLWKRPRGGLFHVGSLLKGSRKIPISVEGAKPEPMHNLRWSKTSWKDTINTMNSFLKDTLKISTATDVKWEEGSTGRPHPSDCGAHRRRKVQIVVCSSFPQLWTTKATLVSFLPNLEMAWNLVLNIPKHELVQKVTTVQKWVETFGGARRRPNIS